jgi:importin subunit beta-1
VGDSYLLSPYFDSIITALMTAAEQPEHAANFRASAYEAIGSFVTTSANDCLPTIEKLTMAILERLEKTGQDAAQIVGADDRRAHLELQANLCSVLTSITRRMGSHIRPLCDRIVSCLISIMTNGSKSASSTVMEDAFLTIGAVCMACEADFLRYMDSFVPFLYAALGNHEEHAMCAIAVGIVGDVSRSLNELILPYCDNIMNALLTTLQSSALHRDVKPVIISCFGDVALGLYLI